MDIPLTKGKKKGDIESKDNIYYKDHEQNREKMGISCYMMLLLQIGSSQILWSYTPIAKTKNQYPLFFVYHTRMDGDSIAKNQAQPFQVFHYYIASVDLHLSLKYLILQNICQPSPY